MHGAQYYPWMYKCFQKGGSMNPITEKDEMKEPYATLFKNIDFDLQTFHQFNDKTEPFNTVMCNQIQRLKQIAQSQTEILRMLAKEK